LRYERELLRDVEGYTPGEQPQGGRVVKLNTNENPYPPSPRVIEALRNLAPDALRRYPDPVSKRFRMLCAERHGYPGPEWVIAGNGMDELLAMALRTFVDPGDDVLAMYPTYSLYEVLCKLHGANIRYVQLDEQFALTEEFFSTPGRLCFLTRPNAPTGLCCTLAEAERVCATFPGVVVIDEAYVDFAADNCMDFPKRFPNCIVMRTFSKSFSLAGMRLGIAVAQPELIVALLKTKDSYNLDACSQSAGTAAMEDYAYMQENAARVAASRDRLRAGLLDLGFDVGPSQANFLLARWNRTPNALEIFRSLRDQGILVRYFDAPRLQDALRITVGTDEEGDELLGALGQLIRA
jgi:histidinol-phosphate aminotransferase